MTKIVKEQLRKHTTDTGSSAVQIAGLTEEIVRLTKHLESHSKDTGCRRSLLKKVATRKKFLVYLKNNDVEVYKKVLGILDLKSVK